MTLNRLLFLFVLLACGVSAACSSGGEAETSEAGVASSPQQSPPVVPIVARDFAFEVADTLPEGWVTVEFENVGQEEHFAYLYRLPDDKTFDELQREVLAPFGTVWYGYASGEISREEVKERFRTELPAWFYDEMISVGGPALTEPGESARVTIELEPGKYVLECYVMRPDGTWHTELGMQQTLTVSDDEREVPTAPPDADVRMTLSNYSIELEGEIGPGSNVIEVRAKDRPDGLMPHDINLFRLKEDAGVTEIVDWMDWLAPQGFRAPAPAHSLGGMEHLSPDQTGYVHLELVPGSYAWVSEEYGERGMVSEFTIAGN